MVQTLKSPMDSTQNLDSGSFWNIRLLPTLIAVIRSGNLIHLTDKEYMLLDYFIKNPGRIISQDELTKALWQGNDKPQSNSLRVWINSLRNKIDKDYEPALIHTRIGHGYFIYPGTSKNKEVESENQ